VGVAVADIDAALSFYRDVLGIHPRPAETADGATIVSLPFGEIDLELLQPVAPDSPVAKFLDRRGPGIHHICFRVPDLDRALDRCRAMGFRVVDQQPRTGAGGHRIAFLHPRSTAGILLELTE
jgi:methylmalonyl-CoA epimerase